MRTAMERRPYPGAQCMRTAQCTVGPPFHRRPRTAKMAALHAVARERDPPGVAAGAELG